MLYIKALLFMRNFREFIGEFFSYLKGLDRTLPGTCRVECFETNEKEGAKREKCSSFHSGNICELRLHLYGRLSETSAATKLRYSILNG